MDKKERLKKQLDFIMEIDKVKNIFRQTYLADGKRKENDAEHSWHLALMAVLLKEYSNEEVDLSKVIPMVLAHDLVEIDAGDTYAYDEKGATTKEYREKQAAERIYGLLPEDQGQWLKALWEEFEAYETPEAKFAHVLDNCQPLFLNDASNGKSWEEHQVKKSQIYKRNRKTGEGSEVIWEYMKELVDKHIALGHVINDEKMGDEVLEECMKERYGLAKERIREIITEETVKKTVWRFFQKQGKVSFHGSRCDG
mgnify:FL=1